MMYDSFEGINLNISDIIDLNSLKFVRIFTDIGALINFCLLLFYGFIIFNFTPNSMKKVKKLMIFNVVNLLICNFSASALKFTVLMPFKIIFPFGSFGSLNFWQFLIAIYLTIYSALMITDTSLFIISERNFEIAKILYPNFTKMQKITIITLYGSSFFGMHIAIILLYLLLSPNNLGIEILQKHVKNSEILLQAQNFLIMVPNTDNFFTYIVYFIFFLAITIRIIFVIFTIFLTVKLNKNSHSNFNEITKKSLEFMLMAVIIQIFSLFFVAMMPICIGIICIIFWANTPQIVFFTCGCILVFYPTVEVTISLNILKPYRYAIIKIFNCFNSVKLIPVKQISTIQSTNNKFRKNFLRN